MRRIDIDLSAVLDLTGDLFIVTDATGKILFHSTRHKEITILAGKQIKTGEMLSDIAQPDRKGIIQQILHEVIRTGASYRTEVEYKKPDNNPLYLSVTYAPVFGGLHSKPKIYILVHDVTPQKIFERRLSSQAKNINKLVEKANAMVIGLDTRGYVTDWNEYTSRITGYSKNEVYAKRFDNILLHEEKRPAFSRLLETILTTGHVYNHEITMVTKKNKQIIALLSGTPRTSPTNTVVGAVLVGQDVTELMEYRKLLEVRVAERTKELMKALSKEREVVEMKNRFVSIASHEFRTPLASIQGSIESIKAQCQKQKLSSLNCKISEIEKQVHHMTLLLDDVLTYGKSDTSKIQPVLTTIAIRDLLLRIKDDVLKSTGNTHRIEALFVNLPKELKSDEKLLRSIFINLLSNAIKFSPGIDYIRIEAGCVSGHLVVSVRDDGIGIPRNELSKIFEPFLRGARASAIEGTGLGLSIVKKAVELLNGTIAVESQINKGSKFTISIPIIEA